MRNEQTVGVVQTIATVFEGETKVAEDGPIHTGLNRDHGLGRPEESRQVQAKHILCCFSHIHSFDKCFIKCHARARALQALS